LRLPQKVRPLLKRPLGKLFPDKKVAFEHLRKQSPTRLVTIGDRVTADFLEAGFKPDIAVVDFLVMRSAASEGIRKIVDSYKVPTKHVRNPPATITGELQEALKNAAPPVKIVVDGEEDLAVLPALLTAPAGSVVAYGQPGEGVVLIEATDEKKREIEKILRKFR